MVFYQFQQAGNEEYQSKKKWNSAEGIVAAGRNGTVLNSAKISLEFLLSKRKLLCIAKFSIFAITEFLL